jgi:hypothetical protein
MNCQDVREGSSGATGLTEWALVHAHLVQCAECRKEREQLRQGPSSRQEVTRSRALLPALGLAGVGAWPSRLRALPSIASTVSGHAAARMVEAARAGVTGGMGLVAGTRRRLPILVVPPLRAGAASIGSARSMLTRGGDRVMGLGSSSMVVLERAVRSTRKAVRAGRSSSAVALWRTTRSALQAARAAETRALDWLARLRVRSSIAFAATATVRGRLIAASRVGTARLLDRLVRARRPMAALFGLPERAAAKAIVATRAAARTVVTASRRARPFLKVGIAVASLAVLVAGGTFFLPRQWPAHLMPRLWASGQHIPEARRPAEPEPAVLATAPPTVKASPPAPVAGSRPEAAPAVVRSRPAEAPAGVPASPRRPDPLVQVRTAASAETTETAEAPDPSAAIDWLLKGGSGRGR